MNLISQKSFEIQHSLFVCNMYKLIMSNAYICNLCKSSLNDIYNYITSLCSWTIVCVQFVNLILWVCKSFDVNIHDKLSHT